MTNAPSTHESERYTLTMTRDQALTIERACELLARLHIGQFDFVTELLLDFRHGVDEYCRRRDMANDLLRLAAITIFDSNSYRQPKIVEKNIEHERAWSLYTTLRHARSWHEHPEGGFTVNFDKPMNLTGEPMPQCTISKEDI